MKSSWSKLTQAPFCLIIILSFTGITSGQTDRSARVGGASSAVDGAAVCDAIPGDVVRFQGTSAEFVCRGCVTSNLGPKLQKAGTATCTSFSKQMLIEFSNPVADLSWEIYGARTAIDNRGYTVRMNPPLYSNGRPTTSVLARFPGSGITSITISDPMEYDEFGLQGYWSMYTPNFSWTPGFIYDQCNCNRPTFARPAPQSAFSPDWNGNGIPDWRMDIEVSDDDGLVLKNIRLENRYMAEQTSVPYYLLETNTINPATRGELKPNNSDSSMASRLVNYNSWTDDEKFVIEATYVIGKIPEGSTNCLEIIQRFEFYKSKPGDQCEPSATLPCARWKPIVSYKFTGPAQEFHKINIPQRHHFRDNGFEGNSVGLFRDCDNDPILFGCLPLAGLIFQEKMNPLSIEYGSNVITQGQDAGTWDNVHQTFKDEIEEPAQFPHLFSPGCPECVHLHWRWGAHNGEAFGNGKPLVASSTQDVDIGVVRYSVFDSEIDPNDYQDLLANPQSIRSLRYIDSDYRYRLYRPDDVVVWYSSTGHQPQDTFSPTKGAFFNPSYQGMTAPITEGPPPGGAQPPSTTLKSTKVSAILSSEDYPESITFADLYEDGATTFSAVDPATLGTLPTGYAVYNSDVYDIVTAATVSGPHVVTFTVPSETDQTAFGNLRILHIEPDSFDPEKPQFFDRTVLSPDTPSPDFANRKISAKVDGLGTFVLATYTPQPPNTDLADLTVSVSDSPDAVVASTNLTYTVNVMNNGPQAATEVMLKNNLAPEANFVSVTPSQGTCREVEGSVVCSLNSLAANTAATITIVVTPTDVGDPIPPGGRVVRNVAVVKAEVGDTNLLNNSVVESTTVLPDPNTAPTVAFTTPLNGAQFVGPANVTLNANATDADGTIDRVDFYDNGNLLGTGTSVGANEYGFAWNNVPFGAHTLFAVAIDNLGKRRVSEHVSILVNGSASVSLTTPWNGQVFNRPGSISVTANASISGGTISQVDFYEDGILLGTGALTGPNQYNLVRNGASSGRHFLTAVATDNNGVKTTSAQVSVIVNDPPVINLISPAGGSVFSAPANLSLTANTSDWEGSVIKVDFYANGSLIGTKSSHGVNQFDLTWSNVAAGNYSITAVATDNHLATKISAPVVLRVNAAPTVSVVAPPNGGQFTAPANITLTANAADADGIVSKVDFFANGYKVGAGAAIGGGQYSFTWSGVGIGSYGFMAVATDNDGASASSSGPSVTVTTPVLFVANSTTLNSAENSVKARLEALNHTVIVKSAASAVTADAAGKALVVVSSTVTPTAVGTKFRTVAVPVLTWESGIYNNMGMTGSTNKDFGTKTNSTQVSITNPTHPLAAGFSGNPTVASSGTFNWGKPNANASSVAIVVGDTAKTLLFGYEAGAVMPGLTAPARRVGFFMHDTTVLNSSGTALLDAAIRWAIGGGLITGNILLSPTGPVDLTTEGVFDWTHWGLNGPTAFNHKGLITPKITNFTLIGTGAVNWFLDSASTFSWIDGTPTQSASNTWAGVNTNGVVGNGFEIRVPADTNLKTLKLYVGAWYAQGKLEATVSDGSAPAYINSALNNNGGGIFGLYTISYKAGSPGQTLKVRYTILNQYFAPNGNIGLKAAILQ